MLLILTENSDLSTNHVIDWVISFDYPFVRINMEDEIELIELKLNTFKLLINRKIIINYEEIKSVWFRRSCINLKKNDIDYKDNNPFLIFLKNHLKIEIQAYSDYINYLLSKKKCLGNYQKAHINKLFVLNKALEIGFKIPSTAVITNKKRLINFFDEVKTEELITKSSNYVLDFSYKQENYMTYTESFKKNNIHQIPEDFAPSLCQSHIEKKFDIRVFYLNGITYSMAIFSQNRQESKVDFRKYDYENPDRRIPIKIKKEIDRKIIKLMNKLELNTGSIDLVIDKEDNYYFLEVNPIGQYGMVDFPCNYLINKKIAEYLCI